MSFVWILVYTVFVSVLAGIVMNLPAGVAFGVIGVVTGAIIFRLLSLRNRRPPMWLRIVSTALSIAAAVAAWSAVSSWLVLGHAVAPQNLMQHKDRLAMLYFAIWPTPFVAILAGVFGSGFRQVRPKAD